MNSPHVRSWAAGFARRFAPQPELPLADAVARAYSLALNRRPTEREQADALVFINGQKSHYDAAQSTDARQLALTDFAQVMLSLNEFIYVE